jgi:hypothetical protein
MKVLASILVTAALLAACAAPMPAPDVAAAQDVCHVNGATYCALKSDVSDANVRQTICNAAWTRGLRPPVATTEEWKRELLRAYRLPGSLADYEGDHRMPEADLGGDPGAHLVGGRWILTDQLATLPGGAAVPANFSDESPASPNPKDQDETALHDQVCAGRLTLTAARTQLRDRWLLPYPRYRS